MNREEAIDILRQRETCRECVADCTCKECDKAFEMAITALSQEQQSEWERDHEILKAYADGQESMKPCEDAISRADVLDLCESKDPNYAVIHFKEDVECLPPVSVAEKTGRWIKSRDSYGNNHFTCPFCEHDIATKYDGTWKDNYCSNCGAKLEVEE